jgi:LL-diaminopimelate aminotransferase
MRLTKRVQELPPYLYVQISKRIAAKKASGDEVINFGIGDPDIPTPSHIIDELCRAARDPQNHHYPESAGMPEFRRAVASWYARRFGVTLDPDQEIVSLIGAKEGIAHIALCLIEEGDIALIPDPGYPVYTTGTTLCGGKAYYLPINESNQYLPDLDTIPVEILKKAKVLWLNYPNMPTGALASLSYFQKAAEFAARNDIVICHDAPYTEVAYEGSRPLSFLQAKGAKEVGIEFHSLSKTFNMTGWRVGMAVGNAAVIDALRRMKSNLDSGIPQAIQRMAISAFNGPQNSIEEHNTIYQRRRDKIIETLHKIGIKTNSPPAGLYVWAQCPPGYTSTKFAEDLLEQTGVVVTPGAGYGPNSDGYIRLSVTVTDDQLEKGLKKIASWKLLAKGEKDS